jgi:hypothetical protein
MFCSYSEAIEYLYSTNSFVVSDVAVIAHLPLLLLPQRINSIVSLRFTWFIRACPPLQSGIQAKNAQSLASQIVWDKVWNNISSMQHLRKLQVCLMVSSHFWQDINQKDLQVLLDPINKVTRPDTFILKLPFRSMQQLVAVRDEELRLGFPWSTAEDWKGQDLWEELPCTIQRIHN